MSVEEKGVIVCNYSIVFKPLPREGGFKSLTAADAVTSLPLPVAGRRMNIIYLKCVSLSHCGLAGCRVGIAVEVYYYRNFSGEKEINYAKMEELRGRQ